ncbi:hypothetical protein BDF20DRAFT_870169 [Mycotypha africana]|uniref:uncharacterized protein n=1 Tax=Mycotypha africana TaxID=64632 RepID=UPI0022FFCBCA|nr:uncharacterized protein BDF20DRAFT_870169 [Mycotypha africana]KAI8979532.1 hypothetical protein BDF20DRAFT_870169 [Mycotypha africana]
MNNLSESLHYSLGQYAALSQAQIFNPSSSIHPPSSQHTLGSPAVCHHHHHHQQQQTQQLMHRDHITNSNASPHLMQDPNAAAIAAATVGTPTPFHLSTASGYQPYQFTLRMPPQRTHSSSTAMSNSPPITHQQQQQSVTNTTTTTTASVTSPASSINTTMTNTSSISPIIPMTPSTTRDMTATAASSTPIHTTTTTSSSITNTSTKTNITDMNNVLPAHQQQPFLQNSMMPKRTAPSHIAVPTLQNQPDQFNNNNRSNDANSEPLVRVTRPPNAYLLFNKEIRKLLKEQNPTLKVAEISKQIGTRWKNLPQSEKDKYIKQASHLKEEQKLLHPNSMYIRRSRAELVKAGYHFNRIPKSNNNRYSSYNNNNAIANARKMKRKPHQGGSTNTIHNDSKRGTGKKYMGNSTSAATQGHESGLVQEGTTIPPPPKHPLSAYMWYLTEVRPETMRNYPGSNVGQISKLCADRWHRMSEEAKLPWKTKAQIDKERYAREMQIYAIQHDHTLGRGTRLKYRSAAAVATAAQAQHQMQHHLQSRSLQVQATTAALPAQQHIMTINGLMAENGTVTATTKSHRSNNNVIDPSSLFYNTTNSSHPTTTDSSIPIASNTDTAVTPLLKTTLPIIQQQHTLNPNALSQQQSNQSPSDTQHSFNIH